MNFVFFVTLDELEVYATGDDMFTLFIDGFLLAVEDQSNWRTQKYYNIPPSSEILAVHMINLESVSRKQLLYLSIRAFRICNI